MSITETTLLMLFILTIGILLILIACLVLYGFNAVLEEITDNRISIKKWICKKLDERDGRNGDS